MSDQETDRTEHDIQLSTENSAECSGAKPVLKVGDVEYVLRTNLDLEDDGTPFGNRVSLEAELEHDGDEIWWNLTPEDGSRYPLVTLQVEPRGENSAE